MVGLPARGKSYITKKIARYLNWLQHDTKIFNVGERRRVAAGSSQSHAVRTTDASDRPSDSESNPHPDNQFLTMQLNQQGPSAPQFFPDKALNMSTAQGEDKSNSFLPPPIVSISEPLDGNARQESADKSLNDSSPEISMSQRKSAAADADAGPTVNGMDQSASFFDPGNEKAAKLREQLALATLDELLDYILEQGGSVGIFDATNSTLERRKLIMEKVRERAGPELGVLFLESLCIDENVRTESSP
jgi:6-phosphofructo-2-kinase